MNGFGDNPFDDGLDHRGCPPQPTDLKLPKFRKEFGQECKLICWGRCMPTPDGERRMRLSVEGFKRISCGVYGGEVHFIDGMTGDEWYTGKLKFYYTRNYLYTGTSIYGKRYQSIAFRFVVKGDIVRVSEDMPEWQSLILCTKREQANEAGIRSYDEIFVYGGLDIFYDVENNEQKGFKLSLGHNDGWYTHHPKCSARPIDSHGTGDYIGHYCDRGWLFVSPGRNFVFDPGIRPPTGRFSEEALRRVDQQCYTEEAVQHGYFALENKRCIHWYQRLKGLTECETPFISVNFCQGMVDSGKTFPWLTFFSMGYWRDRYQSRRETLHLVEGNIKLNRQDSKDRSLGLYYYGFATQDKREQRKLVDLASNKDVIGKPVDSSHLLYLYNAGGIGWNPKVREPVGIDRKLAAELLRDEIAAAKDRDPCPFMEDQEE